MDGSSSGNGGGGGAGGSFGNNGGNGGKGGNGGNGGNVASGGALELRGGCRGGAGGSGASFIYDNGGGHGAGGGAVFVVAGTVSAPNSLTIGERSTRRGVAAVVDIRATNRKLATPLVVVAVVADSGGM